MLNEQLDTFADETPIELPEGGDNDAAKKPESDEEDTFDNGYYEGDKDSQVDLLDEEVDGEKKEEKKDDKKEEKKEDKEKKEEEKEKEKKPESEDKKEEEEKPKGKTVRLKDGDKAVDISPDATIKVKVKGKNELVTIEELKADYSGKTAWTEKISEANSRMEEAELKTSKLQEEKQEIGSHLQKIASMLDKEDGDPMEAMYYLLDMTGRDVNTYSKRVFDFMEEQVNTMSEMDDVEKELYWTNKKLQSLQSNQAAKVDADKQEKARMELIAKVDRLRESQGVSEEQYVQAHKELIENGYKQEELTPEQVVNYQVMKPHVEKALDLTEQFEEDLSDDEMDSLVHETAIALKTYPKISEQDALIVAGKKLGFDFETVDDDINELNDKIGNDEEIKSESNLRAGKKLEDDELDTFDIFDD